MKNIIALFEDDEDLIAAVRKLREKDVKIVEAFTPYPVHGLDHAMGLKQTRLAICSFIYGCVGMSLALLMMWYMNIQDWAMIIGGKPNFSLIENLPSFIPITFESTVLLAAHGIVITFLIRSQLFPGKKYNNPNPASTDDQLVLEISENDNRNVIEKILKETKAIEIK